MGDTTAMAARFEEAMRSGDMAELGKLLQEYGSDDFILEWPQSGERMSKAAAARVAEAYPESSGTRPRFAYRRMLGDGDLFVIEGTIDYGDGVPVSYVGIGELRDAKIARMTEYFANPFEAPAWRAELVERLESAEA